jgi:hypothetical protein
MKDCLTFPHVCQEGLLSKLINGLIAREVLTIEKFPSRTAMAEKRRHESIRFDCCSEFNRP